MNQLNHIAIIPDGNRRWAKKRRIPSFFGHKKGAETAEKIFREAVNLKIPNFTFWGCSINNVVKRPKTENVFLFKLFEQYFKKLIKDKEIYENKIKISVFGRWRELFPEKTKIAIEKAVEVTKKHNNFYWNFLLAYSGIEEMTMAIQKIAGLKIKNEKLKINEEVIKNNLWTNDLPPVDLVIRTGEEKNWFHQSDGFMMWDAANAQFYFTETLWPDFSEKEFKEAVEKFKGVERKMGK